MWDCRQGTNRHELWRLAVQSKCLTWHTCVGLQARNKLTPILDTCSAITVCNTTNTWDCRWGTNRHQPQRLAVQSQRCNACEIAGEGQTVSRQITTLTRQYTKILETTKKKSLWIGHNWKLDRILSNNSYPSAQRPTFGQTKRIYKLIYHR